MMFHSQRYLSQASDSEVLSREKMFVFFWLLALFTVVVSFNLSHCSSPIVANIGRIVLSERRQLNHPVKKVKEVGRQAERFWQTNKQEMQINGPECRADQLYQVHLG